MHALIIEDEFLTAQLIEDRLRVMGYTSFAFAADQNEAIAASEERCPDLITSDVQLAAGCGIDAVQRICSEKPIPVLYITGSAAEVRERCPWAVVIQKPFGMADLHEGIREARSALAYVSCADSGRGSELRIVCDNGELASGTRSADPASCGNRVRYG